MFNVRKELISSNLQQFEYNIFFICLHRNNMSYLFFGEQSLELVLAYLTSTLRILTNYIIKI